jgi:hypothetical protein
VSRREDVSTAISQHASNAFGHARHARTSCYRADHPRAVPDQPGIFTRLSAGGSRVRTLAETAVKQSHQQNLPSPKSSSHRTPRWREMDSNFQFRAR